MGKSFEECTSKIHNQAARNLKGRWKGRDIMGKSASLIEVLVLGLLRYLRRGLMFDDLEEFVEHGRHILFPKFVDWPKGSEELSSHT
eukprot:3740108-Ditylum_brightwellii.AAC.1